LFKEVRQVTAKGFNDQLLDTCVNVPAHLLDYGVDVPVKRRRRICILNSSAYPRL